MLKSKFFWSLVFTAVVVVATVLPEMGTRKPAYVVDLGFLLTAVWVLFLISYGMFTLVDQVVDWCINKRSG